MIKLILMVRRRPGLTRAAFRDYYEGAHAPLAASLMRRCVHYVRNFVEEEPSGDQDFDVITEFWFDGEGRWSDRRGDFADEQIAAQLVEDELRFMDRTTMRIVVVSEHETDPAFLPGNARPA